MDQITRIDTARATAIIADERMDYAARGSVGALVLTDDGRLADDQAAEPADLTAEDAFRRQVIAWRESMD